VDPAGKAAAATEPTIAAMKGEGDETSPAEQGPTPDLARRVDICDGRSSKEPRGRCWAAAWAGRRGPTLREAAEAGEKPVGQPRSIRVGEGEEEAAMRSMAQIWAGSRLLCRGSGPAAGCPGGVTGGLRRLAGGDGSVAEGAQTGRRTARAAWLGQTARGGVRAGQGAGTAALSGRWAGGSGPRHRAGPAGGGGGPPELGAAATLPERGGRVDGEPERGGRAAWGRQRRGTARVQAFGSPDPAAALRPAAGVGET
jgi:hypothetical protein